MGPLDKHTLDDWEPRCPVPDVPDAPSDSLNDSKSETNNGRNDSLRSSSGIPYDLIQALQSNTRAQLELSRAICELVQSISQMIDSGTVDDGDVEDSPTVGLDGQPIPRN